MIETLRDRAKLLHRLLLKDRERAPAIANRINCQCGLKSGKAQTNTSKKPVPLQLRPSNGIVSQENNVQPLVSQPGPAPLSGSNLAIPLKDWIAKVGTTSAGNLSKDPAGESSTASSVPIDADFAQQPTIATTEVPLPKHVIDASKQDSMHRGAITFHIRPRTNFQRVQQMSGPQLFDNLAHCFNKTFSSGDGCTSMCPPIFTRIYTQEPCDLRVEMSTESKKDFELLERKPEWADELCLVSSSSKSFVVQAHESSHTSWQQLGPPVERDITEPFLAWNKGLFDVIDVFWRPKPEPRSTRGMCLEIRLSSLAEANLLLRHGIEWNGEHLFCILFDGPPFAMCQRACDRREPSCTKCVADHQSADKKECHNCSGEHLANSSDCPLYRKFSKENYFPTSIELSRAIEELHDGTFFTDKSQTKERRKARFTFSVKGPEWPKEAVDFFGRPMSA